MNRSIPVHVSPHPDAGAVARRLGAMAVALGPDVEVALGVRPGPDRAAVDVAGLDVLADGPAPPDWLLEAALLRALAPSHLLFLCVANSARSQMGEGIARALAPDGVRVSSAGSEPSRVRPQAVAALAEIGIDIGTQWSKGTDAVERPVDAVVTLCAEEVCPVWLGSAWRLHWGLPDPAGAGATAEEEMDAFRAVRDELHRRLSVVFTA